MVVNLGCQGSPILAEQPQGGGEQDEVLGEELAGDDRQGSRKPPADASQTPGVVSRKLNVVKNMPTADVLPTRAARAERGRDAISKATAISAWRRAGRRILER